MAKLNVNVKAKVKQFKNLIAIVGVFGVVLMVLVTVFAEGESRVPSRDKKTFDGVIDEAFSDANAESAMEHQQLELADLKREISTLKEALEKKGAESSSVAELEKKLTEKFEGELKATQLASLEQFSQNQPTASDARAFYGRDEGFSSSGKMKKQSLMHTVAFQYAKKRPLDALTKKNPANYVPSGTFAKAVVLGGADADASVNGERQNNGVMLFKVVSDGVLPNNQHSYLKGCFITASTYGDISSERAYVILDKISCAQKGRPLIDKAVTGWAFFAGKAGIKGKATMRDGKVVTWAGISGALSGIAQAAQAAQSIQNLTPYGATSVLPSQRVGSYAGLGGASKAADQLSSYYIKRAEQYHPIIQVGAGNVVNIVFKDGFSLLPDEQDSEGEELTKAKRQDTLASEAMVSEQLLQEANQTLPNYGQMSAIDKGEKP